MTKQEIRQRMKILNRQLNILKNEPLGIVAGDILRILRDIKELRKVVPHD